MLSLIFIVQPERNQRAQEEKDILQIDMASSIARVLRRPGSVISGQAIYQGRSAVLVRFSSFTSKPSSGSYKTSSKGPKPPFTADPKPPVTADEFLKNIYFDLKKKIEIALGVLRKERIILDPDDPNAVSHYASVMKTVREKAGLYSDADGIKNQINDFTEGIKDARSYFEKLRELRIRSKLPDPSGAEKMTFDALDKVEKRIGKPLMRDDDHGMTLLEAEFEIMYKKLGVSYEDLPKFEEQLELETAKAELAAMKKDAMEAVETQKKRLGPQAEGIEVDTKSLDLRHFL